MSYELIFTSAERGLKPGSKGFTTVAMTEGMPAHAVQLCESLSGYVHLFGLGDPLYDSNPVAWSHYRLACGGRTYSVCSRVSSHAKDYTGRTNKIAHHIMLETPDEVVQLKAGPAAFLAAHGLCQSVWTGEPRFLPRRGIMGMDDDAPDFKARAWISAGYDPEFPAAIAQAIWQAPVHPVVLLFDPSRSRDLNPLLADCIRLLPYSRRWDITFCTYFTALPAGADCHIRGCVKGSAEAMRAMRLPNAVTIDLETGEVRGADDLPTHKQRLGHAARTGEPPVWKLELDAPATPVRTIKAPVSPPPVETERKRPVVAHTPKAPIRLPPKNNQTSYYADIPRKKEPPFKAIAIGAAAIVALAVGVVLYMGSRLTPSEPTVAPTTNTEEQVQAPTTVNHTSHPVTNAADNAYPSHLASTVDPENTGDYDISQVESEARPEEASMSAVFTVDAAPTGLPREDSTRTNRVTEIKWHGPIGKDKPINISGYSKLRVLSVNGDISVHSIAGGSIKPKPSGTELSSNAITRLDRALCCALESDSRFTMLIHRAAGKIKFVLDAENKARLATEDTNYTNLLEILAKVKAGIEIYEVGEYDNSKQEYSTSIVTERVIITPDCIDLNGYDNSPTQRLLSQRHAQLTATKFNNEFMSLKDKFTTVPFNTSSIESDIKRIREYFFIRPERSERDKLWTSIEQRANAAPGDSDAVNALSALENKGAEVAHRNATASILKEYLEDDSKKYIAMNALLEAVDAAIADKEESNKEEKKRIEESARRYIPQLLTFELKVADEVFAKLIITKHQAAK